MNSIISWVGGKKALRDLIYLRMPGHYDRYIEVFGGGGWVLFGKPPDKCMEVYNDFNSNLANLFYCVKERPMALLRELSFLPLNSRDEFVTLRKFLTMEEFKSEHLAEELEIATHFLKEPEAAEICDILMERAVVGDVKRAAAFYKIIRYSYGSGCTSYGCQPFDIRKTFTILWEANRRLKDTVIENKDFEALIRQYDRPNAFFYCDPPYFETEGHYEVVFRKEDHVRLRDTLAGIEGKFMVSYNDCEYIRELYQDFQIEAVTRINNLAQRYDNGSEFPEVLIANYDMEERRKLVEIKGVLNEKGCIEIPIVLLAQTGIRTGEEVNLIYLAAGEKDYRNESREFMLKRAEEDPLEELQSGETELKLPPQLLADAHIPLDADLDIVCLDRKIVILPTEDVESEDVPKELLDICADLGIPREKVNIVLRMTEEENGKK